MTQTLAKIRQEFTLATLDEKDVSPNPFEQFQRWLGEVLNSEVSDPTAMTLCTADANARPSGRIVLLKELDSCGFVFFTNYESHKGHQLLINPQASLLFFWKELQRQVRIEGIVEKLTRKESEDYFTIRPRGSQIGAWASHQSSELKNRAELESKVAEIELKYANQVIPCPEYWGGYRVVPIEIEFWQGRQSRLHDRICYRKETENWRISRLSP